MRIKKCFSTQSLLFSCNSIIPLYHRASRGRQSTGKKFVIWLHLHDKQPVNCTGATGTIIPVKKEGELMQNNLLLYDVKIMFFSKPITHETIIYKYVSLS
jgi:hypothetical protein